MKHKPWHEIFKSFDKNERVSLLTGPNAGEVYRVTDFYNCPICKHQWKIVFNFNEEGFKDKMERIDFKEYKELL